MVWALLLIFRGVNCWKGRRGGGIPDPVEGVIIFDSATANDHTPAEGVGCFFQFVTTGELRHLPKGETSFVNFDGIQWHDEQPVLTTNPASYYAIRGTQIAYTPGAGSGAGSGSTYQMVFASFHDEPYASGTPTPWRRPTDLGGQSLSMERWSGTGPGIDHALTLIEIARWSDKVILASAVFEMTDTVD